MELFIIKSFSFNGEDDESRKAVFISRESSSNQFNELYIYDDFSYVYYKIYNNKEYDGTLSSVEEKQLSGLMDKYDEISWDMAPAGKNTKTSDSCSLWGYGKKKEIDNEDKEKIMSIVNSLIKNANENIYKNVSSDKETETKNAVLIFRETGDSRSNKLYISNTFLFTYYELLLNREYNGYLAEDEEKKLSEFIDKYDEVHWAIIPDGETSDVSLSWSLWGYGKKKEIDNEDKETIKSIVNSLIESVKGKE